MSQLLGWEAETDLTALPCVRVDLSVALQEAAVHTQSWGGCSMDGASGEQAQAATVSATQVFGLLRSVRVFLS